MKTSKTSKYIGVFFVVAIITAGFVFAKYYSVSPSLPDKHLSPTPSQKPNSGSQAPSSAEVGWATSVLIDVPFTSQAPFAVWDYFHEETCEEATIVMAYAWNKNINLTPVLADFEYKKITEWETANYGNFENETALQIAQVAKVIYGLNSRIISNPTTSQIKSELDKNHIVVMGMAGRLLNNPNFKAPGPIYHALLIKGYDNSGFITNDPGTRLGNNFHYTYDNLMTAAHDWSGSADTLLTSPAVAIIFSKG